MFISSLKNHEYHEVLNRVMRPLDHVTHRHSPWATAAASPKTESAVQWVQWVQWTMASCMRCPSENMWNLHSLMMAISNGRYIHKFIIIFQWYLLEFTLSNGKYIHFLNNRKVFNVRRFPPENLFKTG